MNAEQNRKVRYFKEIFELPTKRDAILKIIDLTKVTPLDHKRQREEIMKVFG